MSEFDIGSFAEATEEELNRLKEQAQYVRDSLEDHIYMIPTAELEELRKIEAEVRKSMEQRALDRKLQLEKERIEQERLTAEKIEQERIKKEQQEKEEKEKTRLKEEAEIKKQKEELARQKQENLRIEEEKRKEREKEKEKLKQQREAEEKLARERKEDAKKKRNEYQTEFAELKKVVSTISKTLSVSEEFSNSVQELFKAAEELAKSDPESARTKILKSIEQRVTDEKSRLSLQDEQFASYQVKMAESKRIVERLKRRKDCDEKFLKSMSTLFSAVEKCVRDKDYESALKELGKLPELTKGEEERQAIVRKEERDLLFDKLGELEDKFESVKKQVTSKTDPTDRLPDAYKERYELAKSAIESDDFERTAERALENLALMLEGFEEAIAEAEIEAENNRQLAFKEQDDIAYATFKANDRATWKMQPLVVGKGIPMDALVVNSSDEQKIANIKLGALSDGGKPVTGMPYHCHMIENGTGGISFAYNHLGGNRVQPVIYDYAIHRVENKYDWKLGGGRKNPSSAPLPGYIMRDRTKPPKKKK